MASRLACLVVVSLVSANLVGAAAPDGAQIEQQLREAMALPADTQVSFEGEDGKAISREDFARQMAQGKGVMATKDEAAHTATLRLFTPKPEAAGPTTLPAVDLTDLSGRRIRSQDLRGKPTLINFFFEACVPCIKEAPVLSAFARKHAEFNYLAVTFEDSAAARRFVQQRQLSWPVVANAKAFVDAAGVKGFPTYMLVATDGRILGRGSGMDPRSMNDEARALAEFESWVRKTLDAKAP